MPQSSTRQFSGIFISYRRDDTSGHAGRLFDKLVDHFGKDRIFMDIDTIEPGEDFVTVIEDAVSSCEVLIAIIGRNWLSIPGRKTGPFENPNDFVRLEITTALKRDIRVIPVLVQRASMPKPQDLPGDLSKLTRRNAVELSDLRWQNDVEQLINVLDRVLVKREEAVRLAEAARQHEEEVEHKKEEEKQRLEEEKQARQAEEEARQRAAVEQRTEEEERERREAEERARRGAREASKRRAEVERVRLESEARRLAEKEAERRRVEAEQEEEHRHFEEEKRERDKLALIRQEHEAAERQRSQSLQTNRADSQSQSELATTPLPTLDYQSRSNSMAQAATATTVREVGTERTTVLVISAFVAVIISACVVVLIIVGVIWMRRTADGEQQSANINASSESNQQVEQSAPGPSTTGVPQPPTGMVYVPGGALAMGRNSNDPLETPEHQVSVKPFFIDTYEVTCEDYKKFLDANPHHAAPPNWANRSYPAGSARKPVTGVDWYDAVQYSAWCGKRLPSEEEWEFAARGTDGRIYPWGKDWQAGMANTGKPEAGPTDGASGMSEVGAYKGKSPYGAYDMVGNAWEWTASDFKVYQSGRWPSGLDPARDLKVIRGGSWASKSDQATATFRRWYGARGETRGYSYSGFRLVKDITNTSVR